MARHALARTALHPRRADHPNLPATAGHSSAESAAKTLSTRKRPRPAAEPRRSERLRRQSDDDPSPSCAWADPPAVKRRRAQAPKRPRSDEKREPPSSEETQPSDGPDCATTASHRRPLDLHCDEGDVCTPEPAAAPLSPRGIPPPFGRSSAEIDVLRTVLALPPLVVGPPREVRTIIRPSVRDTIVDWLFEVAGDCKVKSATVAVAVGLVDRVLNLMSLRTEELQLVAAGCMMLACKMEEEVYPAMSHMVFLCDGAYHRRQMITIEKVLWERLEYRLAGPTHMTVLRHLAELLQREVGGDLARYAMYAGCVGLHDETVYQQTPGVVAVGCLLAACRVLDVDCEKAAVIALAGVEDAWRDIRKKAVLYERRLFKVIERVGDDLGCKVLASQWPTTARAFYTFVKSQRQSYLVENDWANSLDEVVAAIVEGKSDETESESEEEEQEDEREDELEEEEEDGEEEVETDDGDEEVGTEENSEKLTHPGALGRVQRDGDSRFVKPMRQLPR